MATRVNFYKDKNREWRWNVRASNYKIIIASSESYQRRRNAENNLELVKEALGVSERARLNVADSDNHKLGKMIDDLRGQMDTLERVCRDREKAIDRLKEQRNIQKKRGDACLDALNEARGWGFWDRVKFLFNPTGRL